MSKLLSTIAVILMTTTTSAQAITAEELSFATKACDIGRHSMIAIGKLIVEEDATLVETSTLFSVYMNSPDNTELFLYQFWLGVKFEVITPEEAGQSFFEGCMEGAK